MKNKKLFANIIFLLGLGLFTVISVTVYYLIPIANESIDIIRKGVEELIRIIF